MRIAINLLPPEITTQALKQAKFYKIQAIGVAIILVMTFLTSLTLALRILQSRNMTLYQAKAAKAEQQVSDLKGVQASLLVLKSRLTVISQYLGVLSKQTSMYQLIEKLIPPSVAVNGITVDNTGGVLLTVLVPDSVSLDNLVDNLTTKENNEGKISQISIENLSRGRDNLFRVSFKIQQK